MIEQSNTRVEPAGYLDQYGNFERIAQDWMEEEPGTVWRPVFYEFQQTAAPAAQPAGDVRPIHRECAMFDPHDRCDECRPAPAAPGSPPRDGFKVLTCSPRWQP